MKYLLALSFLLPFYLSGQCYESFEVFGAHGLSNEPNTFLREFGLEENYSPVNVSRFGFGASFRLGRQTYARVAMQFSQYGFGWSSNDLRWGTQHDGDGGFDPNLDPDLSSSVKKQNRDYYGEGFITLGYQLRTSSSWKPFAEVGAGIGKYIASGSRVEYNFIPNDGEEGLQIAAVDWCRSIGYIGRAGLGTNYEFNDHFAVYGMAVFQQHLRTINRTGSAKIHPWQATLELGVRVFVDPG